MMRLSRLLLLGLMVVLLAYAATGVYEVRPGELAVVRRLGRVLDEPRLPGLNIGLPWGLDRVDRVAVDAQRNLVVGFIPENQGRNEAPPPGQVLTGDNQLVDVRATIYYRVDRETPGAVASYVLNADRIEAFLGRAAEVALTATMAGQRVDAVLLGQAKNLESAVQKALTASLRNCQLGVIIESVNLTYVQAPVEVAEVFREVNRARTQKEILEREAMNAREVELSAARQHRRRLDTESQAAHRDRIARAQADADSFLALWNQFRSSTDDPENAILSLYLKEMQGILARFKVRTLSDQDVDHTVVVPGGEK